MKKSQKGGFLMSNIETTKKDKLLKQICFYKELSSEAIGVLDGSFYIEKVKKNLIKEGLIKKTNLKVMKKTALKTGVYFKVQSYYLTPKGKSYLHNSFPSEFSEAILETRRQSNETVERLVKMSDSEIMSMVSGAFIFNTDNNLLKSDGIIFDDFGDIVFPLNQVKKEVFYTEKNGEANKEISKQIILQNLNRGIFFTASEAKKNATLSKKDVSQYRFTTLTGVLLTTAKPYCLYHAGNGYITQKTSGEERIATTLILSYAKQYSLYPKEFQNAKITNAIYFCKNIGAFAKLVLNKYDTTVPPGEAFDNSYIIPITRNGCNIIKKFIWEPEYKSKLIEYLSSEYGYIKRSGFASNSLHLESPDGEAVFVGIDFDVNALRMAIKLGIQDEKFKYKKLIILCYSWQQEYYDEVINLLNTDKITCQSIDEEVFDEIVGFTQRVPVVKSRKRKKPSYSNNSLFNKKISFGTYKNNETNDKEEKIYNTSEELSKEEKIQKILSDDIF